MVIFEPKNRLEVTTPKGKGVVWLVTDYGHETDTIYTIILDDSGEMWLVKTLPFKGINVFFSPFFKFLLPFLIVVIHTSRTIYSVV